MEYYACCYYMKWVAHHMIRMSSDSVSLPSVVLLHGGMSNSDIKHMALAVHSVCTAFKPSIVKCCSPQVLVYEKGSSLRSIQRSQRSFSLSIARVLSIL